MKDPHRQRTTGDGKFALPMSRPKLSGGPSFRTHSRASAGVSSKISRRRDCVAGNKRVAGTTSNTSSSTASPTSLQTNEKGEILCSFCLLEPAALMIKGRVIAEKPLCLNHFYTTRAVRQYADQPDRITPILPKSSSSSRSSNDEEGTTALSQMQLQLPAVQSLFAQAFVELQRELGEEVARVTLDLEANGSRASSNNSSSRERPTKKSTTMPRRDPLGAALMAAGKGVTKQPEKNVTRQSVSRRPDPLATLSHSKDKKRQPISRDKQYLKDQSLSQQMKERDRRKLQSDQEGGFMRSNIVKLPSRFVAQQERLRKEKQHLQEQGSKLSNAQNKDQKTLDGWLLSNQSETNEVGKNNVHSGSTGKYNPYKRRKGNPQVSYWTFSGQPNDAAINEVEEKSSLPSWEEIERQTNAQGSGAISTCPSCKSSNVRSNDGAVIAKRNGDLAKGETWGNKDRSDAVFHRVTCFDCGTTWNEEE